MNKKIIKYKTNNDKLLFIGTCEDEEYYQELDKEGGWSFMGLRPETEEILRERARETEPMDIIGISRKDFEYISNWFDYDKFADEMEDGWLESHDSQAEREDEEGNTLYLGFGSGQEIKGFFTKHNIKDYADYVKFFDVIGLSEEEFNNIILPKIN